MTASARDTAAGPRVPRQLMRLGRRERIAVTLWLILAVVAWNGLYDLLLARSTQNYLFRQAIHQAGLGPWIDMSNAMQIAVRDAIWISTLWASILVLAGMLTVKVMRRNAEG
jgi:hypothetical protein